MSRAEFTVTNITNINPETGELINGADTETRTYPAEHSEILVEDIVTGNRRIVNGQTIFWTTDLLIESDKKFKILQFRIIPDGYEQYF